MKHLYGEFSKNQIELTKKSLRGSIFLLLLCVDKSTASQYENINVNEYFVNLMDKISGLNSLLFEQKELVDCLIYLELAKREFQKPHNPNEKMNPFDESFFSFKKYRKLILDAGVEIDKLKSDSTELY